MIFWFSPRQWNVSVYRGELTERLSLHTVTSFLAVSIWWTPEGKVSACPTLYHTQVIMHWSPNSKSCSVEPAPPLQIRCTNKVCLIHSLYAALCSSVGRIKSMLFGIPIKLPTILFIRVGGCTPNGTSISTGFTCVSFKPSGTLCPMKNLAMLPA